MKRVLKYVYKNLLPGRISQSIDIFKYLRMVKVDDLKEKNVLVLAPHPDDDIIGCGGTLRIYRQAGTEVTVVYMTDGRKGSFGTYDEEDLVLLRKDEAKRAAGIIGIDRLIFLDGKDSELSSTVDALKKMSDILNDLKPDAVFLPFLLDNHPDHMATNDIFVEASKIYSSDIMCYGYEVWTPLTIPNCIVDITETISIKMTALGEHKSQMVKINLVDGAVGLSRYRGAIHLLRDSNAEAFVRCTASEYRRLWEVIH